MKLPSMDTLRSIAILTAVGGTTGIFLVRKQKLNEITGSPYFREAFKILRTHPGIQCDKLNISLSDVGWISVLVIFSGAVELMGEPIHQLSFDIGDENNWCDGYRAKFNVRVKGPKDKGKSFLHFMCHMLCFDPKYDPFLTGRVFFWATTDADGKWTVNRVELELKSQPDRRLLIKDGPCDPE